MDFTEEAKQLGFSDAAVMDTNKLVFMPEYRVFCEENACGNYDRESGLSTGERNGGGDEGTCP